MSSNLMPNLEILKSKVKSDTDPNNSRHQTSEMRRHLINAIARSIRPRIFETENLASRSLLAFSPFQSSSQCDIKLWSMDPPTFASRGISTTTSPFAYGDIKPHPSAAKPYEEPRNIEVAHPPPAYDLKLVACL